MQPDAAHVRTQIQPHDQAKCKYCRYGNCLIRRLNATSRALVEATEDRDSHKRNYEQLQREHADLRRVQEHTLTHTVSLAEQLAAERSRGAYLGSPAYSSTSGDTCAAPCQPAECAECATLRARVKELEGETDRHTMLNLRVRARLRDAEATAVAARAAADAAKEAADTADVELRRVRAVSANHEKTIEFQKAHADELRTSIEQAREAVERSNARVAQCKEEREQETKTAVDAAVKAAVALAEKRFAAREKNLIAEHERAMEARAVKHAEVVERKAKQIEDMHNVFKMFEAAGKAAADVAPLRSRVRRRCEREA
jgi:hypothetical protein